MARAQRVVIWDMVADLIERAPMAKARACRLAGVARSSYYARREGGYVPVTDPIPQKDRYQPAALTEAEKAQVKEALSDPEMADRSVVQAYWTSFDAGKVACSQRSFYRIAHAQGLVGDRRPGRHSGTAPPRAKPTALATRPGDLWSWDITTFHGPGRKQYKLYLAIDVFSRYPVAWRIDRDECGKKAAEMFRQAFVKYGAPRTLHADNGSVMRSNDLFKELAKYPVGKSYSRPRVSDDNPFSESLFKTIKYDLDHPGRFDSIDHARQWTSDFLHRYATKHHHSGLGRHTPEQVLTGHAKTVHQARQAQLDTIAAQHPVRFRKPPLAPPLPTTTGINHLSKTG